MQETLDQLDQLRGTERRVAMATLVATRGTTPKKEGAKMWVGEGGRILGSVTIGGCVDARVIFESEEILSSGKSKLLSLSVGDDDAWDLGLSCGGTVDVLIEAVRLDDGDDAVMVAYDAVREAAAGGHRAILVTPLAGIGGRLVVRDDGVTSGSLGSAALDEAAGREAERALREGRSRSVSLATAGAPMDVFLEVHGLPHTLIVIGAGTIAIPLVRFARGLGWRTILVDARERFATRERFPDVDEIHVGLLDEIAARLPYGTATSVVLVAHDYKFDLPVLRAVLARETAYIGLLGSRRRGDALLEFLAGEGFSADSLARIHVPVGLDIGAESAAEIALAVLAESLAVRARRPGTPLRDRPRQGAEQAGSVPAARSGLQASGVRA